MSLIVVRLWPNPIFVFCQILGPSSARINKCAVGKEGEGGGLPLTGTHQQLVDLPPEPQSVQPTWTLDFFPLLSLFSKVACFGRREGLSLLRLFSLGESFWSGKQACWPLEHDPIVANGKHV